MSCVCCFLHIPKTAGSTVSAILEKNYDTEHRFCHSWSESLSDINQWEKMLALDIDNIQLVYGHHTFGGHQYFPNKEFQYFTFLRDPVDRAVSHYYFAKQKRGETLANINEAIITDDFFSNLQTYWISGAMFGKVFKSNQHMLKVAINNLNSAYVGITEDFDESINYLSNIFKWSETRYVSEKVNKSRPKKGDINKELFHDIRDRNKLDIVLYKKALELFSAQSNNVRQISPISEFPYEIDTDIDDDTLWKKIQEAISEHDFFLSRTFLETLLERHSNNYILLNQAGAVAYKLCLGQEALEKLEKAVSLKPDYLEARNNYGLALLRDYPRKALEQFLICQKLEPSNQIIKNNIILAQKQISSKQA